jgi:hypothetical protein
MNKKLGMDVFSVIKNHLHHDRYSPIVWVKAKKNFGFYVIFILSNDNVYTILL